MAVTQFLFNGSLTHPTTKYVGIPVREGSIGAQISWLDATSSATITLELTNYAAEDAAVDAAASYFWKDSGVTITGPAASAAGSALLNVENVRQKRARLKIVTAATCSLQIIDGSAWT